MPSKTKPSKGKQLKAKTATKTKIVALPAVSKKRKGPGGPQTNQELKKFPQPPELRFARVDQETIAKKKQLAPASKTKPMQKGPLVRNTMKKVSAKSQNLPGNSGPVPGNKGAGSALKTSAINMAAANEAQKQKEVFEKAIKLFNSRNFAEALKLFEVAVTGPSIEVAHVARLHVKMCGQRIQKSAIPLNTPDDRYNFAISLINQRTNLDEAEKHLKAAVQAKDAVDHFHYALALCLGLKGDFNGSSYHLGRAIALVPNNRSIARNDPDFKEILQAPQLRDVMSVPKAT